MSESSLKWKARRNDCGLLSCALFLSAVMAGALVLVSPLAYYLLGMRGIATAAGAALLCNLTGIAALAISHRWREPMLSMLLAMAIRMLPSLAICLLIALSKSPGSYHGFIYFLIAFYLLSLAVETYLTVRNLPHTGTTSRTPCL